MPAGVRVAGGTYELLQRGSYDAMGERTEDVRSLVMAMSELRQQSSTAEVHA